jgi:hypothetical protein
MRQGVGGDAAPTSIHDLVRFDTPEEIPDLARALSGAVPAVDLA